MIPLIVMIGINVLMTIVIPIVMENLVNIPLSFAMMITNVPKILVVLLPVVFTPIYLTNVFPLINVMKLTAMKMKDVKLPIILTDVGMTISVMNILVMNMLDVFPLPLSVMIMMLVLMITVKLLLDVFILLNQISTKINVLFSTAIKTKVFGIHLLTAMMKISVPMMTVIPMLMDAPT